MSLWVDKVGERQKMMMSQKREIEENVVYEKGNSIGCAFALEKENNKCLASKKRQLTTYLSNFGNGGINFTNPNLIKINIQRHMTRVPVA